MNDQFGSGKSTDRWSWWNWIDEKEFSNGYRNWDLSATPWISIKKKELAGKITNLAIQVRDAFEKNSSLKLLSVEDSCR